MVIAETGIKPLPHVGGLDNEHKEPP